MIVQIAIKLRSIPELLRRRIISRNEILSSVETEDKTQIWHITDITGRIIRHRRT